MGSRSVTVIGENVNLASPIESATKKTLERVLEQESVLIVERKVTVIS